MSKGKLAKKWGGLISGEHFHIVASLKPTKAGILYDVNK
jgi:hypothetical protein